MKRIVAIHGGTGYHLAALCKPPFDQYLDRVVHVRDLQARDFDDADIVVVTCRTNAARLVPHRPLIESFLAQGGTVVAMGETSPEAWLPRPIAFKPNPVNYWWWLTPGASLGISVAAPEHPFFRALTLADCTWHHHGTFAPPPGATTLLRDDASGRAVLYEDRVTTPGRLIAMSLDPFYHHGCSFMPATTRFLSRFLPWLKEIH
jgi:hypothetical protein